MKKSIPYTFQFQLQDFQNFPNSFSLFHLHFVSSTVEKENLISAEVSISTAK